MKLSCLKTNLLEGLNVVGRVVPSKSTLPVLGNILLATDRGQLKLAATNLELAISYWVGAHIEDEGAVTLPARLLVDFVSSLPDDRIDMSLTARGHTMHLTCGRFTANIKGIDAEDFPAIPTVSDAPVYSLPPPPTRAARSSRACWSPSRMGSSRWPRRTASASPCAAWS